jgi:hypothetical protein
MTNTNDADATHRVDAPTLARLRGSAAAPVPRQNIEISCTLAFEDESISYPPVDSVSLRGAQREITGRLVAFGYVPAGRWSEDDEDEDGYREWSRAFKPGERARILPF